MNTLKTSLNYRMSPAKKLDPNFAKQLKHVEDDLLGQDIQAALNSAQELLRDFPSESASHYCVARAYHKNGNARTALPHAAMALKEKPDNIDYILLLGRLYLELRLFEHAAPLLLGAGKKVPNHFKLRWAIADFYNAIANGELATKHYEIALTLNPSESERQLLSLNYAQCLQSLSRYDEANKFYKAFGESKDFFAKSLARRSYLNKSLPDSEIGRLIQEQLADEKLPKDDRAELLLALGCMHDNAKDHDRAFEIWFESRSYKSTIGTNNLGPTFVDEIEKFYSKQLFDETKSYGHPSSRPLFVVGMPRSGTTLTEQMLGAHPRCFGAGELGRMDHLELGFRSTYSKPNHIQAIVKNAQKNELRLRAEEVLNLLNKLAGPSARYVIDKMPTHYATLGLSALYFPNAKFIHTQRHPADSFISAFQNNMSEGHSYSYDQATYAEAYLAKENIMAHWRECFPDRLYDLQYERLVARPEETVREVLEFLGLPWDENCMQFFNKGGMVKTFSRDQVRNPIYTSSVYRWKNYEKHLGPLFLALKQAQFEYPEI